MGSTGQAPRAARATALAALLLAIAMLAPVMPSRAQQSPGVDGPNIQGEAGVIADIDARTGRIDPSAAQREAVAAMSARATWTEFGTPRTLVSDGASLATGLGDDPVAAARSFLHANAGLFRLSAAGVDSLEVVHEVAVGEGHAVLLRQRFGDLPAAEDGLVTVAVLGGAVIHVWSSLAGDGAAPAPASLSPTEAFRVAAADVGLGATDVTGTRDDGGWTLLDVAGLAHPQRARLAALPTVSDGVRAVYEVALVDADPLQPTATTHLVDARSGKVWLRHNQIHHFSDHATGAGSPAQGAPGSFTGTTGEGGCGPDHPIDVPVGTRSIDVAASADNPVNDIVLNLVDPTGTTVASADTGTSPEAIHYAPELLVPGTYAAQVCPFVKSDPPFTYSGLFATSEVAVGGLPYPPQWRVFPANPPLDGATNDTRERWCWEAVGDTCDRLVANPAARSPWDFSPRTGLPSFTTFGNQAISGEAWLSPLTPAEQYRPVSLTREYDFPWANTWFESDCDPSVLTPTGNDIDAATTNLFAQHNRLHDWQYELGFTEQTYNAQESNFGNRGAEHDPLLGNSQAGAVTGGDPTYLGRDNANMITLNDGIPPITNMYLWQPIPGAFYPPCVDGDYDMSVIGHEYTHLTSNRMIGGPDSGITSDQGGAMGESWSDLAAVEYLLEYDLVPVADENPFAVGPYVTGAHQTGIRNYGMNESPLNYSDVGYDFACNRDLIFGECISPTQVHADGEIWSATNYDIRQALVARWDPLYPSSDTALQAACADGETEIDRCPGNRRWIQIMFDAWLLMPPDVSMLEARDAYLAADRMRFPADGGASGENWAELWRSFARRGLGEAATTEHGDDVDPEPSFASPLEPNTPVAFAAVDETGQPVDAEVFVGHYEARVTPLADTDRVSELPATAELVPGRYELVARADGFGAVRKVVDVAAATATQPVTFSFATNHASSHRGAEATGDGTNHDMLIDDTEETNWASLDEPPPDRQVTIDLAGDAPVTVGWIQASALLRLNDPEDEGGDVESQNRFSALRSFAVEVCDATTSDCSDPASFSRIFTSSPDAFPGDAPRPTAPDLTLRGFDVPDTAATHVRLVVLHNQCTGGPDFQGEQDADPRFSTDCDEGSVQGTIVRAAELQVFSAQPGVAGKGAGKGKGGGKGKG